MCKKNLFVLIGFLSAALMLCACSFKKTEVEEEITEVETGEENIPDIKIDIPEFLKKFNGVTVEELNDLNEIEHEKVTLESFFADPENQKQLGSFTIVPDDFKDYISTLDVKVEENRFTYTFRYNCNLGDVQAMVEENGEKAKPVMFRSLRSLVETDDPMEIEIIYINDDDSIAGQVVLYEDVKDKDFVPYESQAQEGTIQYFYETTYGPDYWTDGAKLILEESPENYSEVSAECIENTVTFTYVYTKDYGDIQSIIEESISDNDKKLTLDMIKLPAGVEDTVTVIFEFKNSDGSTAARIEFEG
ncbi:MAG: hypothetical protein J5856_00265 [Lachnospiraceae bacterium]|nr:hypothetical protein [Lachnospiraceae bacterium]